MFLMEIMYTFDQFQNPLLFPKRENANHHKIVHYIINIKKKKIFVKLYVIF